MIELQTTRPRLFVKVYPRREIIEITPPNERFVVISIADPGTAPTNLSNLGAVPVLRLKFSIDAPGQGLTREQATEFLAVYPKSLDRARDRASALLRWNHAKSSAGFSPFSCFSRRPVPGRGRHRAEFGNLSRGSVGLPKHLRATIPGGPA